MDYTAQVIVALDRSDVELLVALWRVLSLLGSEGEYGKSLINTALSRLAAHYQLPYTTNFQDFVWNYDQEMCTRECPRTANRAVKYFCRKNDGRNINIVLGRGAIDWVRALKGAIQGGHVELFLEIVNHAIRDADWDLKWRLENNELPKVWPLLQQAGGQSPNPYFHVFFRAKMHSDSDHHNFFNGIIKSGDLERVRVELNAYPQLLTERALVRAATSSQREIFQFLYERNPDSEDIDWEEIYGTLAEKELKEEAKFYARNYLIPFDSGYQISVLEAGDLELFDSLRSQGIFDSVSERFVTDEATLQYVARFIHEEGRQINLNDVLDGDLRDIDFIRSLVERGADPLVGLENAIKKGRLDAFLYLTEQAFARNKVSALNYFFKKRSKYSEVPFEMMIDWEDLHLIKLMFEHARTHGYKVKAESVNNFFGNPFITAFLLERLETREIELSEDDYSSYETLMWNIRNARDRYDYSSAVEILRERFRKLFTL